MQVSDERVADESLALDNLQALKELMQHTMEDGHEVRPRGQLIKEVLDGVLTVSPLYPFQTFVARKYDIEYFKKEMLWKLGASRMDDSIKRHAKMWESVQNPDGSFNSNYGQYWFGTQMGFWKALMELIRDEDSRRATIPMLSDAHMTPETTDTVCTEAITFHIRANALHMSVHMRSSDQVFGLGTDIPTFSVLYMLMLGMLRTYRTRPLHIGYLTISAASSHIYERHFKTVDKIISEDLTETPIVELPESSGAGEVMGIIAHRGKVQEVPSNWRLYEFIYGQA